MLESKADAAKRSYDEHINNLIAKRTRCEDMVSDVSAGYYKLPDDLKVRLDGVIEQMPEAVKEKISKKEPFTLKDLIPAMYPFGSDKRKEQAQQTAVANKLFDAWEELRDSNYEEMLKCASEYKQKNL